MPLRACWPRLRRPHMLRHSCGYKLANDGQDTRAIQHYLGHRSINSTVRYTALAPDRFKGFWKDSANWSAQMLRLRRDQLTSNLGVRGSRSLPAYQIYKLPQSVVGSLILVWTPWAMTGNQMATVPGGLRLFWFTNLRSACALWGGK